MLTRFFSKSAPINYILLSVIIAIGYILYFLLGENVTISIIKLFKHLLHILIIVFSMLLLDFIVRKNNITKKNTYTVFIFTTLLLMLPVIFKASNTIITTIFLLLTMRRIMSLRTEKNLEKKILDASLYATIASFFSFWALLIFIFIYIAIFVNTNKSIKYLSIPIVGFLGTLVLAASFYSITQDSFNWFWQWRSTVSLDFSAYNETYLLIPATLLLVLLLWTGGTLLFKYGSISLKDKPTVSLLFVATIVFVAIAIASEKKTGGELLYLIVPVAMMAGDYFQRNEGKRYLKSEFIFKEVLLWSIGLLSLTLFFYDTL